jgi:hypothetical protein
MQLSTGKVIPNDALWYPFAEGYVSDEEWHDVIEGVILNLSDKGIGLIQEEMNELNAKWTEICPDLEKAIGSVWVKHGMSESTEKEVRKDA